MISSIVTATAENITKSSDILVSIITTFMNKQLVHYWVLKSYFVYITNEKLQSLTLQLSYTQNVTYKPDRNSQPPIYRNISNEVHRKTDTLFPGNNTTTA